MRAFMHPIRCGAVTRDIYDARVPTAEERLQLEACIHRNTSFASAELQAEPTRDYLRALKFIHHRHIYFPFFFVFFSVVHDDSTSWRVHRRVHLLQFKLPCELPFLYE